MADSTRQTPVTEAPYQRLDRDFLVRHYHLSTRNIQQYQQAFNHEQSLRRQFESMNDVLRRDAADAKALTVRLSDCLAMEQQMAASAWRQAAHWKSMYERRFPPPEEGDITEDSVALQRQQLRSASTLQGRHDV